MSLRFRCAECGATVRLPEQRRDRKNYCPRCDARLPEPNVSAGSGWVVALVLGIAFVGLLAFAGCGVLIWFVAGDQPAAPVAQPAPGPVAAVDPEDEAPQIAPPPPPPLVGPLNPPQAKPDNPPFPIGDVPLPPPPLEIKRPVRPVAKGNFKIPPSPGRLAIKPLELAERKEFALPDVVERVIPAGGGRFLVCHFPKLRKAGVFDVSEGKLVRYIGVPEDKPLFAAGMSKLVVYLPNARAIQRYDLVTGNREANKLLGVNDVKAIAMGSASAGPVVVTTPEGGRLFDLDTLNELDLPIDEARDRFGNELAPEGKRLPFHDKVWASANGRMFVGPGRFSGAAVMLEGSQVRIVPAHSDSWMYAQPSADGKYVFRGGCGAVTAEGQKSLDVVHSDPGRNAFAGYFFLPAADGPYYFHIHFTNGSRGHEPRFQKDPLRGVTVYMYGLDAPIARMLDIPDMPDFQKLRGEGLPVNEMFHLIPRARLFVTLAGSRDKLILVPLDLNQALDESEIDFLVTTSSPPGTFTPGADWAYPIRVRSKAGGVRFTLESGPDGMKVGADGKLTWRVPLAFADPEVTVIVGLKDAAGKEAFHTFRMALSKERVEYTPEPEPEPVRAAANPEAKANVPRVAYRLPPAPPAPEVEEPQVAARTEVAIPEKFDRVMAAGDGRFLVLHAQAARRATVFDAAKGAVVRSFDLGDDKAVVAAGMTQIVVYRPGKNEIEKFNLLTGASEGKKPIPTRAVTEMFMGSASAGPVLVRTANSAELYDLESLQPMSLPKAEVSGFPFTRGAVWVSADGRTFGNTMTRAAGSFIRLATLEPDSIRVSSELMHANYAVPSGDGKKVYISGHGEFTNELKPSEGFSWAFDRGPDAAYHFLPSTDANYFLVLHTRAATTARVPNPKSITQGVTVWSREPRTAVAFVNDVFELSADIIRNPELPSFIHFVRDARLLAAIPATKDRVVVYPIGTIGTALAGKKPIGWKLPPVPAAVAMKPVAAKKPIAFPVDGGLTAMSVGGGGRYIVVRVDSTRLKIFDVCEGKFSHEVKCEGSVYSFAAGLDKLVTFESGRPGRMIRRYDLATGKVEASAGGVGDVSSVVMGSSSAGPILGYGSDGLRFLDLATLAPLKAPDEELGSIKVVSNRAAASADGRTFVVAHRPRVGGKYEDTAIVLKLDAAGVKRTSMAADRVRSVAASADGKHIFLGGHGIYTSDLKPAADAVWAAKAPAGNLSLRYVFAPAVAGPYYLHWHSGVHEAGSKFAGNPQYGFTLYKYGQDKPLGHYAGELGANNAAISGQVGFNHVFTVVPEAKAVVTVDRSLDKLHLIPFDPENIPPLADPEIALPKPKTPPKAANAKDVLIHGKPFRLTPLPEPLPIEPLAAAKTIEFERPSTLSPAQIALAGGGRFLLVQRDPSKVQVIDLSEGKVVRQIDLSTSSTRWVAGMSKLVSYEDANQELKRYDLLTGKEDLAAKFNAVPVVMGSASDGPFLAREATRVRFYELQSLTPMDMAQPVPLSPTDAANRKLCASPDGRFIGVSRIGVMRPSGAQGGVVQTISLAVEPEAVRFDGGPFPSMYAVPDPTGRYIFAGGHGGYDFKFKKSRDLVRSEDPSPREPPVHYYLPAQDGPFYLKYHFAILPAFPGAGGGFPPPGGPMPPGGGPPVGKGETGVEIYAYGKSKPIVTLRDVDPFAGTQFHPSLPPRIPQLLFLIPRAKLLVAVSHRADKVSLIPVDLRAEMARSGVEVPWVTSLPPRTFKAGEEFKYKLEVASKAGGLKYVLESPAAGMAVYADGVFVWTAPADAPAEVRVVIRVTDKNGGESVHAFPVTRQ